MNLKFYRNYLFAVFQGVAPMFGYGMLTLPILFAYTGYATGLIIGLGVIFFSIYSNYLLFLSCEQNEKNNPNCKKSTFANLVSQNKILQIFTHSIIVIDSLACLIAYFRVCGLYTACILNLDGIWATRFSFCYACIQYLFSSFSSNRLLSIISVISVISSVFVACVLGVYLCKLDLQKSLITTVPFKNMAILSAIGNIIFSIYNQTKMVDIFYDFKKKYAPTSIYFVLSLGF